MSLIRLDNFCFSPNPLQARALDQRMRLGLADSLQYIAEQSESVLRFDFSTLDAIISDMRSGARYPPSAFSLYADIVLAICNDLYDEATLLLEELAREKPLGRAWRVLPLDAPEHVGNMSRYVRAMSGDSGARFFIGPPRGDAAERFQHRTLDGYRLMKLAMPELAAEFDELVADVIMVTGDAKAEYQFDGGSSYFLWGALFLNVTSHETEVAMVEVLAHESAHLLLYACAAEEALVTNSDEERYASPLRRDPRPMDGIYHATFVSARMHWAMTQLIESGLLSAAATAAAEEARTQDARNFWSGHDVVSRYGKLTRTGSRVMQSAADYMASFK